MKDSANTVALSSTDGRSMPGDSMVKRPSLDTLDSLVRLRRFLRRLDVFESKSRKAKIMVKQANKQIDGSGARARTYKAQAMSKAAAGEE